MTFVLDASTTLAWCFDDEANPFAEACLSDLSRTDAVVPALWKLEVTNVLLVAERRGRISAADGDRFWALLLGLPIAVDDDGAAVESLLAIGRELGLSAYDATYLELASRRGLPLATLDERLRDACARRGIELFVPTQP